MYVPDGGGRFGLAVVKVCAETWPPASSTNTKANTKNTVNFFIIIPPMYGSVEWWISNKKFRESIIKGRLSADADNSREMAKERARNEEQGKPDSGSLRSGLVNRHQ